jgi:hypothetical protein
MTVRFARSSPHFVIPAKAGIHFDFRRTTEKALDPRLRGDDEG